MRALDHRAGLIKEGTLQAKFIARDRRVFAAAAAAHSATGAPILTHCEEGRGGIEQVEVLVWFGVEPNHIALSHTDKVDDLGYHRDLVETGVHPRGPRGEPGILEGFNMNTDAAEDLILRARVVAGWITQEDYDTARAPKGIEDLDEEARAEAESLLAAEKLLGSEDGSDETAGA